MQYFAVIGNKDYFVEELTMLGVSEYTFVTPKLCLWEGEEKQLSRCSQMIKWGNVMKKGAIQQYLEEQQIKLIGTDNKSDGLFWKRAVESIKRFKEVGLDHADKDIKQEGVELVLIDKTKQMRGIVKGWQDIELYQTIDFERPVRSMDIGMMPAKLTLLLLNLIAHSDIRGSASSQGEKDKCLKKMTIWDPFVGLGTTGLLANWMGYHFVGSDLNITPCKQNFKWWKTTKYFTDSYLTLIKHDVTKVCTSPLIQQVDAVVTEGWLGPRISHLQMPIPQLYSNLDAIWTVYKGFLEQMIAVFGEHCNLVFTSPRYVQITYGIGEKIQQWCQDHFLQCEAFPMYMRKGQKVGRELWKVTAKTPTE